MCVWRSVIAKSNFDLQLVCFRGGEGGECEFRLKVTFTIAKPHDARMIEVLFFIFVYYFFLDFWIFLFCFFNVGEPIQSIQQP